MKRIKIPTVTIPQQPKKAVKKKTAVKPKKSKPGRIIGHPPMDAMPPDIRDSRPVKTIKMESGTEVNVHKVKGSKVATPQASVTPAKRDVVMTGRIVQGQTCTWLGDLGEAGDDPSNPEIPVCPYCSGKLVHAGDQELARMGNRLYELGSYEVLPSDKDQTPARAHPNYVDFVAWMKTKPTCWSTVEEAAFDYQSETGKVCNPER